MITQPVGFTSNIAGWLAGLTAIVYHTFNVTSSLGRITDGNDLAVIIASIPLPQTYVLLLFCAGAALAPFFLKKRNTRISQEISDSHFTGTSNR